MDLDAYLCFPLGEVARLKDRRMELFIQSLRRCFRN